MDNGKTIVFKIKPNIYFNNGKPVTSDLITYNFSDVTIERPDKQTIIFKLKDAYAPFLVTASRPVFAKGFVGIGNYQIQDIVLNSAFVQSLTLVNTKNQFDTVRFRFYPSEEALKMAFLMGDITQVQGLTNENYNNDILEKFRNANVQKKIDYSRLVTLFYNTTDGDLSDKKVRLALNYALPGSYTEGERAYLPYPPKSIYYNSLLLDDTVERNPDYNHAKLLLSASDTASGSAISIHSVTIKTFKKYHTIAKTIASAWKKLGITTKIEDVDSVPSSFQIFLGDFKVPQDPDQYALWHSSQIQINNITKYKNLRIDKLLEDGRKTTDINQRKQIYANFQKYLMADAPASFLYFPKEYEVNRK
jgi:peptide/nickel transport system substrate-binding protein